MWYYGCLVVFFILIGIYWIRRYRWQKDNVSNKEYLQKWAVEWIAYPYIVGMHRITVERPVGYSDRVLREACMDALEMQGYRPMNINFYENKIIIWFEIS